MFTVKIHFKDDTLIVIHEANIKLTPKGITVNEKFHYKFTKVSKIEVEPIV